jgi:hypothetical protein
MPHTCWQQADLAWVSRPRPSNLEACESLQLVKADESLQSRSMQCPVLKSGTPQETIDDLTSVLSCCGVLQPHKRPAAARQPEFRTS